MIIVDINKTKIMRAMMMITVMKEKAKKLMTDEYEYEQNLKMMMPLMIMMMNIMNRTIKMMMMRGSRMVTK
jgi:hypothetical protein